MRTTIEFIDQWNEDVIEVIDHNDFYWTCTDVESLQYMLDSVLDGEDKYIISVLGFDGWSKESNTNACDRLTQLLNDYPESKRLFNHSIAWAK